jgi:hypothetical protein
LAAILGLVVLGGVPEVLQGFTGRDPSFLDEAANAAAALGGDIATRGLLGLLRIDNDGESGLIFFFGASFTV